MRTMTTVVMLSVLLGGVGAAHAAETTTTNQHQSTVAPTGATAKTATTAKAAAKPMHPRKTSKPVSHAVKPKKKPAQPKTTQSIHPDGSSTTTATSTAAH